MWYVKKPRDGSRTSAASESPMTRRYGLQVMVAFPATAVGDLNLNVLIFRGVAGRIDDLLKPLNSHPRRYFPVP